MIPFLKAIPLRLYLYAALALFIGYLLWREHYLSGRVKALRSENTTLAAQVGALETAAKQDSKFAAELAAFRQQQTISFRQFDETLARSKVTREVRYVTDKGEPVVCVERDAPAYRGLYNQAVGEDSSP